MSNINPNIKRAGIPHPGLGPRSETIAFLIWCAAEKHGWDMTLQQLHEETGVTPNHLGRVLRAKGWLHRIRATYRDDYGLPARSLGYHITGEYHAF